MRLKAGHIHTSFVTSGVLRADGAAVGVPTAAEALARPRARSACKIRFKPCTCCVVIKRYAPKILIPDPLATGTNEEF